MRLGALIHGTARPQDMTIPDWIERIDYAVAQLKLRQQQVVKAEYMDKGKQKIKAKNLSIDLNYYRKTLCIAKEQLAVELFFI